MKRSPRTIFDDSGNKWYQSPIYKEVKTDIMNPEGNYSLREEYGDNTRMVRDRFYDFFNRITRMGESKIDLEELNKSLTIKVDEIPDSTKISDMFEKLNSKVVVSSKGKKNWSEEENIFFVWLIINYCELNRSDFTDLSDADWEYIASVFPGKKAEQCKIRWQSLLKINLSKAPWTQKEDELLCQIITEKGSKKWKEIAIELNERAGNTKFIRQGKQCRERWINHLDPNIDRGAWSAEEDIKLLEAHIEFGKKWADISKRLKSRTENAVKNRWNSLMKKYKNETLDSDTMSTLSAQSGGSIEDLERRIAHIIINDKRNELTSTSYHLPSVNEEDEYTSTGNEINEEISKAEEEERSDKKKFLPKKKLGPLDIGNTLKELVSEELDKKQQQKKTQQVSNPLLKSPLLPTGISQINNRSFINNPLLGNQSTPKSHMNNQKADPTTTLFTQINSFNPNPPMSGLFGVSNDMFNLNLLMMNPNPSLNLFGSNQQSANNNTNNQANIMHSPPSNMMSPSVQMRASTGLSMNSIGGIEPSNNNNNNNFSLPSNIQTVSAYPDTNAENNYQSNKINEDEKIHKYHEKSIEQLDLNSVQTNSLQYAIVDNSTGAIYFISPVNKDNFPPNFLNIPKATPKENPRKPTFDVMTSPALGNVNFSPGILNNNLFNLVQNQFSPSVNNILRESPQVAFDRKSFPTQQNPNTWEWAENHQNQIPFMNDPNRIRQQQQQLQQYQNFQQQQQQQQQNLVWGGAYKMTNSPDQRFGINSSAFLKKQGMVGPNGEGTSPTSFIDSNRFGKMFNKQANM